MFLEQPGAVIAPFILRAGVYFQDAPVVAVQRGALRVAFESLATHRTAFETLGIGCTFTSGSDTRDDRVFGWSDEDLTEWFVGTSENRDLVRLWDLRNAAPDVNEIEEVLAALVPVWVAWNAL